MTKGHQDPVDAVPAYWPPLMETVYVGCEWCWEWFHREFHSASAGYTVFSHVLRDKEVQFYYLAVGFFVVFFFCTNWKNEQHLRYSSDELEVWPLGRILSDFIMSTGLASRFVASRFPPPTPSLMDMPAAHPPSSDSVHNTVLKGYRWRQVDVLETNLKQVDAHQWKSCNILHVVKIVLVNISYLYIASFIQEGPEDNISTFESEIKWRLQCVGCVSVRAFVLN